MYSKSKRWQAGELVNETDGKCRLSGYSDWLTIPIGRCRLRQKDESSTFSGRFEGEGNRIKILGISASLASSTLFGVLSEQ
jgi:hypothetical protein